MKKAIVSLFTFLFAVSLVACGDGANTDQTGTSEEQESEAGQTDAEEQGNTEGQEDAGGQGDDEGQENAEGQDDSEGQAGAEKQDDSEEQSSSDGSSGDIGTFQKDATLDETVIYEADGVKITAKGLEYTNYSVDLGITVENNSGKDLGFVSGSLGYSCNSVNGYMIPDGYFNCDVPNGKSANESISFGYDALMLFGINEIADLEIGVDITDNDYNHTYTGPLAMQTSAAASHDYGKDYFQESITSDAAMKEFEYGIPYFTQDVAYDVNGVKMLSSGIMEKNGETMLFLEMENTSSDMIYETTSDIAINDLVISGPSNWSVDAINPGKRGILLVGISSVLAPEYWPTFGIEGIGTVSLSLGQLDPDGNELAGDEFVELTIPDTEAGYDASGTEIYNSNGLRIVTKAVTDDLEGIGDNMHILLLAENTSGGTITISQVYNSLSVNGYMMDYYLYSKRLADGQAAVLDIELTSASLEENGIASTSDVTDAEIGLEIESDTGATDEPVITMTFE